jgi:hypothetical protein
MMPEVMRARVMVTRFLYDNGCTTATYLSMAIANNVQVDTAVVVKYGARIIQTETRKACSVFKKKDKMSINPSKQPTNSSAIARFITNTLVGARRSFLVRSTATIVIALPTIIAITITIFIPNLPYK